MSETLDPRKRYLFSKRHYEFVAAHMVTMRGRFTYEDWLTHVMQLAAIFKKDNPRFHAGRFMQSCGLTRATANRALEGHADHLT